MRDSEFFDLADQVRALRGRIVVLEAQVQSLQMAAPRGIPKAEPAPSDAMKEKG